jgi:hypothetical protein
VDPTIRLSWTPFSFQIWNVAHARQRCLCDQPNKSPGTESLMHSQGSVFHRCPTGCCWGLSASQVAALGEDAGHFCMSSPALHPHTFPFADFALSFCCDKSQPWLGLCAESYETLCKSLNLGLVLGIPDTLTVTWEPDMGLPYAQATGQGCI